MTLTLRGSLGILLLATAVFAATDPPLLERERGDRLLLTRLPPLLDEEEVNRQLTTGLTTTFSFRIDLPKERRGRVTGAAQVEIRYELWDEQFLVRTVDGENEQRNYVLGSREELTTWWQELRLVVIASPKLLAGQQARVSLEVVPFSRSEQLDTQRWLSDSVSRGEASRGRDEGGESLGRVFSVLIATSIQRRPLSQYRWNLTIPAEDGP